MAKNKYDRDKKYSVQFKDKEAERSLWIHIHCLTLEIKDKKDGYTIYQLMDLYEAVWRFEEAYGGFLNLINDLDPTALSFLKIKVVK